MGESCCSTSFCTKVVSCIVCACVRAPPSRSSSGCACFPVGLSNPTEIHCEMEWKESQEVAYVIFPLLCPPSSSRFWLDQVLSTSQPRLHTINPHLFEKRLFFFRICTGSSPVKFFFLMLVTSAFHRHRCTWRGNVTDVWTVLCGDCLLLLCVPFLSAFRNEWSLQSGKMWRQTDRHRRSKRETCVMTNGDEFGNNEF